MTASSCEACRFPHIGRSEDSLKPYLIAELTRQLDGEPIWRVTGKDLRMLRAPIIYAWMRREKLLYIGSSEIGIARPVNGRHERLRDIEDGDEVAAWRADGLTIRQREEQLIDALSPELNGRSVRSSRDDGKRTQAIIGEFGRIDTRDLVTLDEVCARFDRSRKTVKKLYREESLPLFRMTPRGQGLYAFWSDIETWLKSRRGIVKKKKRANRPLIPS